MENKEVILELLKTRERLDLSILKLAGWSICVNPFFSIVGDWDCKKSPSGLCCYDHYIDKSHDECVFCGMPEERK